MRTLLSISLVYFFSILNSQAQIQLLLSDMPSSGDTIRVSNASQTTTINLTQTGPNTTWDFTTLKAVSQEVKQFKSSAQTPYFFYFIGTFGEKIADTIGTGQFTFTDVYKFYKKNTTDFSTQGIGFRYSGIPLAGNYSDIDEIFKFPLDYSDKDTTTFKFKVEIPSVGYYGSQGTRINVVDGWGTVKTPFGNFPCLRVKSTITAMDSVSFNGFNFGFPNNSVEYKWMAKSQKIPILQVTQGFTGNSIVYRDFYRNLATGTEQVESSHASLYPNPTSGIVHINAGELNLQSIQLYSVEGKMVLNQSISNENKLDLKALGNGIYFATIWHSKGFFVEKIIVNH